MWASHSGHLPVVELLIGQPWKKKAKLTDERFIMSYGGDFKAAKLDARNSDGWTALMLAGSSEIASALIGAGADIGVSCNSCGKAILAHHGIKTDDGKDFVECFYTDIEGKEDYHAECFFQLGHEKTTLIDKAGLHKTTMAEKRKMAESRWKKIVAEKTAEEKAERAATEKAKFAPKA